MFAKVLAIPSFVKYIFGWDNEKLQKLFYTEYSKYYDSGLLGMTITFFSLGLYEYSVKMGKITNGLKQLYSAQSILKQRSKVTYDCV